MHTLEPIIKPGLKILFIGQNPANESCRKGIYFSSNSKFWKLLHQAGLTREVLVDGRSSKGADQRLLDYKIGITDLYHADGKFVASHFIAHERARLEGEIKTADPKILCFLGKKAYRCFLNIPRRVDIKYGWQKPWNGHRVFIAVFPSTTPKTDKEKLAVLADLVSGLTSK